MILRACSNQWSKQIKDKLKTARQGRFRFSSIALNCEAKILWLKYCIHELLKNRQQTLRAQSHVREC